MGRLQSSIGLITGTDIAGTVDQLIALSARPRDRLVARTETLQAQQKAITELMASVVGVQLAGNGLAESGLFRSTKPSSSDSESLSVTGGNRASPATYSVRTIQTALTHSVSTLQRFASPDESLGLEGSFTIRPNGGFLDESLTLASLNGGRGVEDGVIRLTDRSGASADVDLSGATTIDEALARINDANVGIEATTIGDQIQLTDTTGRTDSNLVVEQLGAAQTAADLGLWGIDVAATTATGTAIELPTGATALNGVPLSELGGGNGIGPLTALDIELSDGSTTSIDLSAAASTSEVIDAINSSGAPLIARLNDARNGLQLRDVSGGTGTFTVSSTDNTATELGVASSTTDSWIIGQSLNRQTVTRATLLADLNQGVGITSGSFTITDSSGSVGAINLKVNGIESVGELLDSINGLGIGVSASLNDSGDGIAVVDTAGGSATLTIEDTGLGTAAADLGIAGIATTQTVGGVPVSALVGTQADTIEVEAGDSLADIASKLNETSRYAAAEIRANNDNTFSLRFKSRKGGEAGQFAVNTDGLDLDLRTETLGQDALIAISTDGGPETFLSSADGVFEIDQADNAAATVSSVTELSSLNNGSGIDGGSFTITDSNGAIAAINITAERINTVGELIDAINSRDLGVTASINEAGTGVAIVDEAGGTGVLTIEDTGDGSAAGDLGIAGTATQETIGGQSVSALIGPKEDDGGEDAGFSLTLKKLSETPVTVTVEENPDAVVTAVKTFVSQYNSLVEKLESLTFFDQETEEVGLLFGSTETLRIETGYNRLLSGRIGGAGAYRSVGQVGIGFKEDGTLELDEDKLANALAEQPGAVESFFAADNTGLADRLDRLAERVAGATGSLLITRNETLSERIVRNQSRVETLNERLEAERERLLKQFIGAEEAIAKLQANQSAIASIQPVSLPQSS